MNKNVIFNDKIINVDIIIICNKSIQNFKFLPKKFNRPVKKI